MKKWLSLVLAAMLLLTAVPALAAVPAAPAFLASVQEWLQAAAPETLDYVADLAVLDTPFTRGTLRAGNGITELVIATPAAVAEEETVYADIIRLQYADNGLAVQMGEKVWLINVQEILECLTTKEDYTSEAVKADITLLKELAARFVLEVLNPALTYNMQNGSVNLHFDVDQDQLAERIPAYLDSLTAQEDAINALLLKYGAKYVSANTDLDLSLAGIRAAWEAWIGKYETLPAITLQADAAVTLPKDETPLQAGIAGILTVNANEVNFTAEYLPTRNAGFIAAASLSGTAFGKAFDHELHITRAAGSVEAVLSLDAAAIYHLNAGREDGAVYASLLRQDVVKDEWNELAYLRTYDAETGDLLASLNSTVSRGEDLEETSLVSLAAAVQDRGVTGVLTAMGQSIRFTYTTASLYHRLQLTVIAENRDPVVIDTWLFPQSKAAYRFRVDVRAAKHYLLTGSVNSSSLTASLSEIGIKRIADVSIVKTMEEGVEAVNATAAILAHDSLISAYAILTAEEHIPTSLDSSLIVTSEDGAVQKNIYKLAWVPGKATYIDGINYYNLERTVDAANELTYVLTRNQIVELGRLSGTLSEDGQLALALEANSTKLYSATITPVEPIIEKGEVVESPVVIGQFEGTMDEDGNLYGIVTQPEEVEEEVIEELKIQPIDVENATVIDVAWLVKNACDSMKVEINYDLPF